MAKPYDSDKLWPIIFNHMAEGGSLSAALKLLKPSPSYWWAKQQLRNNPELRKVYQEVQEDRADRIAEELFEIADAVIPAGLEPREQSAWVMRQRMRLDVRKWSACKLSPRQYGDKLEVTGNTTISIAAALAEANKRLSNVVEGEVVKQSEATLSISNGQNSCSQV